MPAEKIIRNESNLDRKLSNRHLVSVTVEDVIAAINSLERDVWTTCDVANLLCVNERSIRATIRRLKRRRLIRKSGRVLRLTRVTNKEYFQTSYELVTSSGGADFDTLNRVFCGA